MSDRRITNVDVFFARVAIVMELARIAFLALLAFEVTTTGDKAICVGLYAFFGGPSVVLFYWVIESILPTISAGLLVIAEIILAVLIMTGSHHTGVWLFSAALFANVVFIAILWVYTALAAYRTVVAHRQQSVLVGPPIQIGDAVNSV
jgi:apolipoprotein N-acyltransferase